MSARQSGKGRRGDTLTQARFAALFATAIRRIGVSKINVARGSGYNVGTIYRYLKPGYVGGPPAEAHRHHLEDVLGLERDYLADNADALRLTNLDALRVARRATGQSGLLSARAVAPAAPAPPTLPVGSPATYPAAVAWLSQRTDAQGRVPLADAVTALARLASPPAPASGADIPASDRETLDRLSEEEGEAPPEAQSES